MLAAPARRAHLPRCSHTARPMQIARLLPPQQQGFAALRKPCCTRQWRTAEKRTAGKQPQIRSLHCRAEAHSVQFLLHDTSSRAPPPKLANDPYEGRDSKACSVGRTPHSPRRDELHSMQARTDIAFTPNDQQRNCMDAGCNICGDPHSKQRWKPTPRTEHCKRLYIARTHYAEQKERHQHCAPHYARPQRLRHINTGRPRMQQRRAERGAKAEQDKSVRYASRATIADRKRYRPSAEQQATKYMEGHY
ncbi:hypothetical protein SAMN05421548_13914 [Paraburkholderia lycopersici]|uniref:Uncharacterized protein n=1 Tax=Paraburkholderia lycopersici TaxID=416944 RepID=A0A1G7BET7_9BURK|nr:hypothetical protein SAMN05421548_13914 [Paraburkholderia lycopersici]